MEVNINSYRAIYLDLASKNDMDINSLSVDDIGINSGLGVGV